MARQTRRGEGRERTGVGPGRRQAREAREGELDRLQEETARELGLEDELAQGEEMTTGQAGQVGGRMVRKRVRRGEEERADDDPVPLS